jgi:hypothetical protein
LLRIRTEIKIKIKIKIRTLKDQGGAGDVLESVFDAHMGRADALETVANRQAGQFRFVAFPADVAEVKLPQLRRHDLLKEGSGVIVGKMAFKPYERETVQLAIPNRTLVCFHEAEAAKY